MIIRDFIQFLKENSVISLALAFIMGAASNSLVKSFVDNVLMALVDPLTGGIPWQEAAISMGPVHLKYGAFLSECLHFVLLAFVVFLVAKKLFKMEKIKK